MDLLKPYDLCERVAKLRAKGVYIEEEFDKALKGGGALWMQRQR